MDLIHKLEKARTKDDLEALGIEHLGIDVDKRKAKEVLRAELIGEAESQGFTSEAAGEPEQPQETVIHPEKMKSPTASGYTGKLGRNRNTGRMIPWTSAMAKMPHMEEV
jgi:hypothetical protein